MLDDPRSLEQRIRERAYTMWQQDGQPENSQDMYWGRAEKLELMEAAANNEKEKLRLEQEKINIERNKFKWTAIAVFVPLAVLAGTFYANFLQQRSQARDMLVLETIRTFVQASNPHEAVKKVEILSDFFPDELAKFRNISDQFQLGPASPFLDQAKNELFRALAAKASDSHHALTIYRELFGGQVIGNDCYLERAVKQVDASNCGVRPPS